MLVLSVGGLSKKLRWAGRLMVVVLLALLVYYVLDRAVLPTAAQPEPIISQEGEETHYPGEPVRVYGPLDDYWTQQLAVLEK